MLVEAGYDVWLGNYIGNTYSIGTTHDLNPDEGKKGFWDFTWDEMAKYDIPTQIEKVLKITGKDKIQWEQLLSWLCITIFKNSLGTSDIPCCLRWHHGKSYWN